MRSGFALTDLEKQERKNRRVDSSFFRSVVILQGNALGTLLMALGNMKATCFQKKQLHITKNMILILQNRR